MASAIVVGASGITGRALVERLCHLDTTTKVYAISRRPVDIDHSSIEHAPVNLRSPPSEIAEALQGVTAEYIYFCAYTAPSDPQEMFSVNNALLQDFLTALEINGSISKIRRFILTCGLKQYGCHLGESKQPMTETDPMLVDNIGGVNWPANFYYTQQNTLSKYAQKYGFEYVATLPKDVIGYARGNFMNQATALGLYCAVSQALPGSSLPFPGNRDNFFSFNTWTSADLHARFSIWASTAPGAGNHVFNVLNGDTQSWQDLWPKLAERFGCTVPEAPFTSGFKSELASSFNLATRQPVAAQATELGVTSDPKVRQAATIHVPIDLEKWSKLPEVVQAWGKLRDEHGLDQGAWDGATWGFMNMAFGRQFSTVASMSKARKLGWTSYADTWEEFDTVFKVLQKEKILPPSV